MASSKSKPSKPRRARPRSLPRGVALRALGGRIRPVALAAAAIAATFGAGAIFGFVYRHEPERPPAQVATVRPAPVRPTAPRIETPPVEPPRLSTPAEAVPPESPPPAQAVKPVPAPAILASVLPPPMAPAVPPAQVAPGTPAWLKNALPFTVPHSGPMIAIVIDDMGLDRKRSARVVGLPGPLTLAWLPYANDLPRQTRAARAAGHELMVHIPMEPQGGDIDPGPGAMTVSAGSGELLRRLEQGLKAFDGYIGINNHMGSRFTEDRPGMRTVLSELHRRGLMFLDSRTTTRSVASGIARELQVPTVGRDVFLDHDMSPASVRASLAKVEAVARRQGYAVAIGHPHDATVDALAQWLPAVAARGFALVPVSAVLKHRQPNG
ncbi:divergent polysaccharide deacetylase family protein [Skermanella rosea]|uniref:divergent polysaccharide deacetylase family protein n=1 Tax=Skermanella rosea TaxID=1817965 RepID=UPI0019333769|nr:divergent polysaccharide deacetylase family protein [Skermanella rosea]UEM06160.1 divergent polysaccharide deacetylase family protein [Skermanella rosea]